MFSNLNLPCFFLSAVDLVNSLVPFSYRLPLCLKNKTKSLIYLIFYRLNNYTSFKLFDLLWSVFKKLRNRKEESEQKQISGNCGGSRVCMSAMWILLGKPLEQLRQFAYNKMWLVKPFLTCPSLVSFCLHHTYFLEKLKVWADLLLPLLPIKLEGRGMVMQ